MKAVLSLMPTLRDIFLGAYGAAESHALFLFGLSLAFPLLGTAAAWFGRGGKTDRDGRLYANILVLVAAVQFALAMTVGSVGMVFLERSPWDTPVLVLLAPFVWLILTVLAVRRVFPLSELAGWRSVVEVGQFFVAVAVVLWLVTRFRGWGILFFGSLAQLVLALLLAGVLLHSLYRRAFRREE